MSIEKEKRLAQSIQSKTKMIKVTQMQYQTEIIIQVCEMQYPAEMIKVNEMLYRAKIITWSKKYFFTAHKF